MQLKGTIKDQEEEIKHLKKELKELSKEIEQLEEDKDYFMQICNSCPRCQWQVQ